MNYFPLHSVDGENFQGTIHAHPKRHKLVAYILSAISKHLLELDMRLLDAWCSSIPAY